MIVDINLLTLLFVGCFGAASFLSYQFYQLTHEMQELRVDLKESRKSNEQLKIDLRESRVREIGSQKKIDRLESVTHDD